MYVRIFHMLYMVHLFSLVKENHVCLLCCWYFFCYSFHLQISSPYTIIANTYIYSCIYLFSLHLHYIFSYCKFSSSLVYFYLNNIHTHSYNVDLHMYVYIIFIFLFSEIFSLLLSSSFTILLLFISFFIFCFTLSRFNWHPSIDFQSICIYT